MPSSPPLKQTGHVRPSRWAVRAQFALAQGELSMYEIKTPAVEDTCPILGAHCFHTSFSHDS